MLELTFYFGAFLITYFGVRFFRAWSVARGVIDHPNERSSHSIPTPRGGGLIMAAVIITIYALSSYLLVFEISLGFVAGAVIIVSISWLDDVYSVSFVWRLLAHSTAAGLLIFTDGWFREIAIPGVDGVLNLGYVGILITFCWIIWLVNAYNFMDGIDGIAGIQAVSAAFGWLAVGLVNDVPAVHLIGGTVLFASLAFLLHNWPPARIFMGDSGSAFLGFVFAGIPLLIRPDNDATKIPYAVIGVLLVWLFVFDSVFTFVRRLLSGEKVWQAHRKHLYQRLVISGYSHRKTTMLYGSISFFNAAAVIFFISNTGRSVMLVIYSIIVVEAILLLLICHQRRCLWGHNS